MVVVKMGQNSFIIAKYARIKFILAKNQRDKLVIPRIIKSARKNKPRISKYPSMSSIGLRSKRVLFIFPYSSALGPKYVASKQAENPRGISVSTNSLMSSDKSRDPAFSMSSLRFPHFFIHISLTVKNKFKNKSSPTTANVEAVVISDPRILHKNNAWDVLISKDRNISTEESFASAALWQTNVCISTLTSLAMTKDTTRIGCHVGPALMIIPRITWYSIWIRKVTKT